MVIFNHTFALGRVEFFFFLLYIFKRAVILVVILGVGSFSDGC